MTRYYGVKCKTKGTPVALEEVDPFTPNKISFNMLPLKPYLSLSGMLKLKNRKALRYRIHPCISSASAFCR
jgi:hypothetical protein